MQTSALLKMTLITAVLMLGANIVPARAASTIATAADKSCIKLPPDFSRPAVAGVAPPESLWKGWKYADHVALTATPITGLVDQSVTVKVTGLQPGEPVTLRASMSGYRKHEWVAHATFVANASGEVDVARQAPKYGTYAGVHAMGLVWSMLPEHVERPQETLYAPPADNSYPLALEALANGKVLAKVTLTRYLRAPGVTKTEVSQDGMVGELFMPATPGPHPAVIVLGGSEGGLYPQVNEAALLASHGYIALGLAYFQGFAGGKDPRLAHLPQMLVNIPLEYFIKAADWLKKQPGVDPRHVAIMGWSKGAEAALITTSEFPKAFQAVVGFMPSSVVWSGIQYGPGPASSSWTLGGKPLPWVEPVIDPAMFGSSKPIAFLTSYRNGLKDAVAVRKAAIPAEKIAGPVLLISASDDQIWPSSQMSGQIMQRLAAHHHAYNDESICYAGAGHVILPAYRPTNASVAGFPGGSFAFGGEPVAYAFADRDAWNHVLAFLQASLNGKAQPDTAK